MQETLFGLVLDRSGSMGSVVKSTIDGVNQLIADQKEVEGKLYFTETQFDHTIRTPYVGVDIRDVPAMTQGWGPHAYTLGGSTALFDAVGTTIKGMERWVERHNFKGQVKMAILTDGMENASREWHIYTPTQEGDARDVLGLIQWMQGKGWEFLFLGAGGSSWLEKTFGSVVAPEYFFGYQHTDMGHSYTYAGVSNSLLRSRTIGASFNNAALVEQGTAAGTGLVDFSQTTNVLNDGHSHYVSSTTDATKTVAPLTVTETPRKAPVKKS